MAVSLPKYACAVKTAPLMNEDLTAVLLFLQAAVRFADLTKQKMAATTPKRANAATCPLNCPLDARFVALCPLSRKNRKTHGISAPLRAILPFFVTKSGISRYMDRTTERYFSLIAKYYLPKMCRGGYTVYCGVFCLKINLRKVKIWFGISLRTGGYHGDINERKDDHGRKPVRNE